MANKLFYYEWQANFKTATEKGIKEANLVTTVTVILVLTAGKLTTRARCTDLVWTAGKLTTRDRHTDLVRTSGKLDNKS